jgi:prepilin-type N-terminal cleavage/methylation domain-containing protein
MDRSSRAFTLVELLVVVAIIAVLISLLTPAIESAVYQAELAVCGSKHRALGLGATSYAADHARRYPYRLGVQEMAAWPTTLSLGGTPNTLDGPSKYDDRSKLRPYLGLSATLNCPLVDAVDFEGSKPDSIILGSQNMWFGFQYRRGGRMFAGMHKVGDQWEWDDTIGQQTVRSSLLTGTPFLIAKNGAAIASSHPDKNHTSAMVTLQDSYTYELAAEWNFRNYRTTNMTVSSWNSADRNRGPIDLNEGYADLSVVRLTDVVQGDARVAYVGEYSDGKNWPEQYQIVPMR